MKSLTTILIIIGFLSVANAHGQTRTEALNKTIRVFSSAVRVDSLLRLFSKQTGIGFSFNSKKISPSTRIPVTGKPLTLSQWLVNLEQLMGVQHKWVGNHVILIDNSKPPAIVKRDKTPASRTAVSRGRTAAAVRSRTPVRSAGKQTKPIAKNPVETSNVTAKPGAKQVTDSLNKSLVKSEMPVDTMIRSAMDTLSANRLAVGSDRNATVQDTASIATNISSVAKPAVNDSSILSSFSDDKVKSRKDYKERGRPGRSKDNNFKPETSGMNPWEVVRLSRLDIGPQGIGVSFERKLSPKTIIDLGLGLGGGYAITGHKFIYKLDNLSGPEIYASVNPRFYYNRAKRFSRDKSLKANAGNYFGFRVKYVTDVIAENFVVWDAVLFNIHWGMQRPLGKRWVANGHIGPGYGFAKSLIFFRDNYPGLNHAYLSFELRISYLFNKEN